VCRVTLDEPPNTRPPRACVQVTAYRDGAHNNAIPAFFARLMGMNALEISARAVGQARVANSTKCLRPIAIPDRWAEATPPWTPASTFDWWDPAKPQDDYNPPELLGAGSGLTLAAVGTQVTLTEGVLTAPIATIQPWRYLPIEIPGSQFGAAALRQNTNDCAASEVAIADQIPIAAGDLHTNAQAIADGLGELIADDPGATWNAATKRVANSCADHQPSDCRNGPRSMSPRIIALALFDPWDLANQSHGAGATSVAVTNIVGFFVETVNGTDVTGYITTHPGLRDAGENMLFEDSSFLRAPALVE